MTAKVAQTQGAWTRPRASMSAGPRPLPSM